MIRRHLRLGFLADGVVGGDEEPIWEGDSAHHRDGVKICFMVSNFRVLCWCGMM